MRTLSKLLLLVGALGLMLVLVLHWYLSLWMADVIQDSPGAKLHPVVLGFVVPWIARVYLPVSSILGYLYYHFRIWPRHRASLENSCPTTP